MLMLSRLYPSPLSRFPVVALVLLSLLVPNSDRWPPRQRLTTPSFAKSAMMNSHAWGSNLIGSSSNGTITTNINTPDKG